MFQKFIYNKPNLIKYISRFLKRLLQRKNSKRLNLLMMRRVKLSPLLNIWCQMRLTMHSKKPKPLPPVSTCQHSVSKWLSQNQLQVKISSKELKKLELFNNGIIFKMIFTFFFCRNLCENHHILSDTLEFTGHDVDLHCENAWSFGAA